MQSHFEEQKGIIFEGREASSVSMDSFDVHIYSLTVLLFKFILI